MITFEKVLVLKNLHIFKETSEMALADLVTSAEEKTYREKELIIEAEEINPYLYVILSGRVQLKQGRDIMAELEARQFFGETTVLNPMPFPCDVVAVEKTTVLRITGDALYKVMALHPSLARGFLGDLSKRLHQELFRNK